MRVGHRGQAAAQGWRVELRGVGATLLQELSVCISLRLAASTFSFAAALFPQLSFAVLASRSGGFLAPGGRRAAVVFVLRAATGASAASFQASGATATAGLIQAAAGAVVPHLLRFGLHVRLNFQTVVPATQSQ